MLFRSYLKKKDYVNALKYFEVSEQGMLAGGNKTNIAILYKHLGKCYAETAQYKEADAAWMKEAVWWKKVGYLQDAIHAERKAYLVRQDIRLFTVGPADDLTTLAAKHIYHGAKYEPVVGTFIGAYAEGDKAVPVPRRVDVIAVQTGKVQLLFAGDEVVHHHDPGDRAEQA